MHYRFYFENDCVENAVLYLSLERVPGGFGLGQLLLEAKGLLALLLLPLLLQRQAGLQLGHLLPLLLLLHVQDLELQWAEDMVGEEERKEAKPAGPGGSDDEPAGAAPEAPVELPTAIAPPL